MKAIISIVVVLLSLIAADYQGLLGIKTEVETDYFALEFEAEDVLTQAPIVDFYINCTRKGSRNACSVDQGKHQTSRKAKFAIVKQINKTWLFKKNESILGENEVDVHLMFIHPNYERLTQTYSMKQLLELQRKTIKVKLERSST